MKILAWIVGVPIGLLAIMFAIGAMSGPPTAKEHAREVIKTCWADQARKSHSASQAQFVAAVCETAEKEFRTTYGSAP